MRLSADGTPVEVVRGLELRLEAGSFGALIGPSGCGKTTILKIAAGLDRDFRGRLRKPGSGRLGIVFQQPRLLPWRTVEDNIRLALPAREAAADLTELVEMLRRPSRTIPRRIVDGTCTPHRNCPRICRTPGFSSA